jgi:hypothetical protein
LPWYQRSHVVIDWRDNLVAGSSFDWQASIGSPVLEELEPCSSDIP